MNSRPALARLCRASGLLATTFLASTLALADTQDRPTLVLTSSNDASSNSVLVFELQDGGTPALSLVQALPTGGSGGAGGNGGILQFANDGGAVANFGSNTVSRLSRSYDRISVDGTIALAAGCLHPDSVALGHGRLYVVGANCAESHRWPDGAADRSVVALPDSSAAQIAAGNTWAAVTLKSGSVLRLPLAPGGALSGGSVQVALPGSANDTPLGAAFWGDLLGFTPAHSADSFALVNRDGDVFPVVGPTPPYPTNAPCWVAKGRGNVWYTGNSPAKAISIFFSDGEGGMFYKSLPLPGVVTDLAVSPDGRWLAAIYLAGGSGFIAVLAIDAYGDLTPVASSSAIGVTAFSGVAISQ
jgi:hypothetical protein